MSGKKRVTRKQNLMLWIAYAVIVCITWICVKSIPMDNEPVEDELPKYLCDLNSSTEIGSTKRDVVLLFATSYAPGLELCIRSLRSTGSRCRIVLFVGPEFSAGKRFRNMVRILEVEVVSNCQVTRNRPYVPHMLRFEYELKWLKENRGKVDRVFHTDSFDVYFQGDPFANHVSNSSLTFVVEPHQIRSCGWNLAWVRECYGDDVMRDMRHNFIICSGSIAGGAQPYIDLVELMISTREWDKCWDPSKDQPILNYLVWKGLVKKAGIKYQFTGCDGGFFTVQWCVIAKKENINEHGQIVSEMKHVPSFIHQYNRLQSLSDHLYDSCHMRRQRAT